MHQLTNFFCQFDHVCHKSKSNHQPNAENRGGEQQPLHQHLRRSQLQMMELSQLMLANQALSSGNQPLAATDDLLRIYSFPHTTRSPIPIPAALVNHFQH